MNTPLQKIGAWYDPSASEFIVWAPLLQQVDLVLEDQRIFPMEKDARGYWTISLQVPPGICYQYRLDGQQVCPDPASFALPRGVHGPSQLVDRRGFSDEEMDRPEASSGPADRQGFRRDPGSFTGLPLADMVIYEIHTGCFSEGHDFEGIVRRLDHLAGLGINTLELMPLGQFAGDRNWGYDGVYPFAVQASYGGPGGFRQLVDAAHARDIAVLVDVVYNHIGPEGNYFSAFGPYYTTKYTTPWGKALNFDDAWADGVRNYFLQNARMWLEEFQVDGLRLDAVHAIKDFSACHFIRELKELALDIERRTGRKKVLIAEIDLNDPLYIGPPEKGGYNLDGQWIDEFHHALHSLITGERTGYYEDFGEMDHLEKAFRQTYVYNGVYSPHRKRVFGGHAEGNPFSQFVVFAQNHDHIGNRALGDRLTATLSMEQLKLTAATVLLSPYVPLIFMGEEYGEKNPFQYFVGFDDPALIDLVRKGRAAEFGAFAEGHVSDPQSAETFERSCLSWNVQKEPGPTLLRFYRHLISLRKTRPAMRGTARDTLTVHPAGERTLAFERMTESDHLYIWLHFGGEPQIVTNKTKLTLRNLFSSADPQWLGPAETEGRLILPGAQFILFPFSAHVFEKISS